MTAEQFLADIEAKAQVAQEKHSEVWGRKDDEDACHVTAGGISFIECSDRHTADHIAAANPSAVLRLVEMIYELAQMTGMVQEKCAALIEHAYQQTEPKQPCA